jgi:hypothetical protein
VLNRAHRFAGYDVDVYKMSNDFTASVTPRIAAGADLSFLVGVGDTTSLAELQAILRTPRVVYMSERAPFDKGGYKNTIDGFVRRARLRDPVPCALYTRSAN